VRVIKVMIAAGCCALAAPATSAAASQIPPAGTVIMLEEHVSGAKLSCGDHRIGLDLQGQGTVTTGETRAGDGHRVAALTTQTEDLQGTGPVTGDVTVTETRPVSGGLAVQDAGSSVGIEELPMRLTFAFQHDPCAAPGTPAADEPLLLETRQTARFIAEVRQSFPLPAAGTNPDGSPAGGQLYQLQTPTSLGTVDSGGATTEYAQLQGMNINVGQLLA
jgi:hypothetical protein